MSPSVSRRASRPFLLCFDNHATDGKVWAVRTKGVWRRFKTVRTNVPMATVYRGREARQPRAFLTGFGRLVSRAGHAEILP